MKNRLNKIEKKIGMGESAPEWKQKKIDWYEKLFKFLGKPNPYPPQISVINVPANAAARRLCNDGTDYGALLLKKLKLDQHEHDRSKRQP